MYISLYTSRNPVSLHSQIDQPLDVALASARYSKHLLEYSFSNRNLCTTTVETSTLHKALLMIAVNNEKGNQNMFQT